MPAGRMVLMGRPPLSLRRGLWRLRVLLLRLVLLDRLPLSLRWGLWRRWVLLLQDPLAGLELREALWGLVVRAHCLHSSGSRRW